MRRTWRVVLLAVLVLPVLAYAAGALTSSSPRDPEPRPTIILEDPRGQVLPGSTLRPSPATPSASTSPPGPDVEDDDDEDEDDDGVTVIRPHIGEDDDDDGDDDDDESDDD
ncbi:hypothetical protein [Nocardioides salarius]|uniref:hypothetical protein n=1 Tax=Nocardioides salarius TaxID=374513 RepID=UPI0030F60ABF